MKNYTELKVEIDDMDLRLGVGMEPLLAQLVDAIRDRVVPPDAFNSDGTEAKASAEEEAAHRLRPW